MGWIAETGGDRNSLEDLVYEVAEATPAERKQLVKKFAEANNLGAAPPAPLSMDELYSLNDDLTAELAGMGWSAETDGDYDNLNDLVHEVAEATPAERKQLVERFAETGNAELQRRVETANPAPPAPPAPPAGFPQQVAITVPAQEVQLNAGSAPVWPDGWKEAGVSFGEDDSGRFFTSWTLEDEHGEQYHLNYTDYEDGPDFDEDWSTMPNDDVDATDLIEQGIVDGHDLMRTNSYRVGRSACERDPSLADQVTGISLGGPRNTPSN